MEQYVSDLCFVLKHNKDITRVDVEQVIYNIPTNKIKKFIKSVEGNGLLELYNHMNVLSIKFVLQYYIDRDMTSKFLNMTLENIYAFLIKYIYEDTKQLYCTKSKWKKHLEKAIIDKIPINLFDYVEFSSKDIEKYILQKLIYVLPKAKYYSENFKTYTFKEINDCQHNFQKIIEKNANEPCYGIRLNTLKMNADKNKLTDEQYNALVKSTQSRVSFIIGQAGTGKTTCIKTLIDSSDKKFVLVARTGKAVKVLENGISPKSPKKYTICSDKIYRNSEYDREDEIEIML